MASDIVPIQLALTAGDLVTLWAPQWREDGEEWEAFLGNEDAVFAFPEVTQLAAFVRTAREHDLVDHPAWPVVPELAVAELAPDDTQRYDVVGVPELVGGDVDRWTIGELAAVTGMVRSIADVCGLDTVTEVLDSAPGFELLNQGALAFDGRKGGRLWTQLTETITERWDDVLVALDDVVHTPPVDPDALAVAEKELAAAGEDTPVVDDGTGTPEPAAGNWAGRALEFWNEVGIDPIRITTEDGEYLTLRCYLDDAPVFLGSDGRIDVFPTERTLTAWIGGRGGDGHDLVAASTWPEVVERARVGALEVDVDPANVYVLAGLDDSIADGTLEVDPQQLELAAELLVDAGDWAGDDEPREALADEQPLGRLVAVMTKGDPSLPTPGPQLDAEAAELRRLVADLRARLRLVRP
jgi:hypothetical protein